MRDDGPEQRPRHLEQRAEREPDTESPRDPDPTARRARELMHDPEQDGLWDEPDPRLEQTSKEQLLARPAEHGEHDDPARIEPLRKGPELAVKAACPGITPHRHAGEPHDGEPKPEPDARAPEMGGTHVQPQRRRWVQEWRTARPDQRESDRDHCSVRGRKGAPANHLGIEGSPGLGGTRAFPGATGVRFHVGMGTLTK